MIKAKGFENQKVFVFGLGKTGIATIESLLAGGAEVLAWDDAQAKRAEVQTAFPTLKFIDPDQVDWSQIRALSVSPGVPLTHPQPHPVVRHARVTGAEVFGDVDLLAQAQLPGQQVAITGTNGKSTTTALIGHIIKTCGRPANVGGNLGVPVLTFDPLPDNGIWVLETSSYQIDLSPHLSVDVAILLNLTPDHLDRHGDMAGYAAVKTKLLTQAKPDATLIIGVDDPYCTDIAKRMQAEGRCVVPLSVGRVLENGLYVIDGILFDARNQTPTKILDLTTCRTLPGTHNWQNAAAAYGAAMALGLDLERVTAAIQTFPGLAHRQEWVRQIGHVSYVNDSKATNADATEKALLCYPHIHWIVGGRAKAGGIEPLRPYFDRIKQAYLIGEAAQPFAETLGPKIAKVQCGTLDQALAQAHQQAQNDNVDSVVLLSPACASFDQFRSFEERGDLFRQLVLALETPLNLQVASGGAR